MAASYVNFYLANGAVILPGYGVPEDELAVRLFQVCSAIRNVLGCRVLYLGHVSDNLLYTAPLVKLPREKNDLFSQVL